MRTRSRSDAALLAAVLTGSLLAAAVPVALGADSAPATRAAPLRAENDSIEAQARTATLELYALETRLGRMRSTLAGIASTRAAVERERVSIARHLRLARAALDASQKRLGDVLRALYQQGGTADPLEVVLGASSIDAAMSGLDGLDRAAEQSSAIIEQTRAARLRLEAARVRLARQAGALSRLAEAAEAEAGHVAAAVAEREAYVAELRHRRNLNAARIATIEVEARAIATRSRATESAAHTATPPAPAAPVRAVPAGRTLTVTSTGYVLRGHTSSGVPTGPGVVAVDPSVIPLGTRMTVPGYGDAVAADTGSSVLGNTIDLWFPTLELAHAWGRRTVTITLR